MQYTYGNFTQNTSKPEAGGFLNTSEGFNLSFTSPTQADRERNRRLQNVVPCTVAQILGAPRDVEHLKVGSLSAHILTLVGIVGSVDIQAMKITYTIDDLTEAPLEVQLWLGENDDSSKLNFDVNSYIRVTGSMRTVKDKRLLIAFKVQPVLDMNELTMHLLEVIHTAMAIDFMDNQKMRSEVADINFSESFTRTDMEAVMSGLTETQKMVLQAIAACKDEDGLNCNILYTSLPLNRKTIDETIEFLNNEGHIYSTVDDVHYKATD